MRVRNDRKIDVVNVCFYVGEKEAEESDETNETASCAATLGCARCSPAGFSHRDGVLRLRGHSELPVPR